MPKSSLLITSIICFIFFNINIYSQDFIISSYDINDPYEGQRLLANKYESSSYLRDKSGIDYSCKNAFDGKLNTAWCISGNVINEWLKIYIKEDQYIQYKGMMNVYRIIIINGLAVNKNIYFANNRIKKMRVEFSEGQSRILQFKDGILDPQKFRINIKARWAKFIILDTYKGSEYNDTCMSEIWLETATHPSEMTPIQRKNWGYK